MSSPLHVLIIGGGIGGLTLAQGLSREGVSATVYERDRTPTDRLQGYRVHISPTGSLGLHECLPPNLFEVFDRTCGSQTVAVRFFTEQMRVLLAFERASSPRTDVDSITLNSGGRRAVAVVNGGADARLFEALRQAQAANTSADDKDMKG